MLFDYINFEIKNICIFYIHSLINENQYLYKLNNDIFLSIFYLNIV